MFHSHDSFSLEASSSHQSRECHARFLPYTFVPGLLRYDLVVPPLLRSFFISHLAKPLNDANNFTFGEPARSQVIPFSAGGGGSDTRFTAALFQEISLAPFALCCSTAPPLRALSKRESSPAVLVTALRYICVGSSWGAAAKGQNRHSGNSLPRAADTLVANLTGISLTFFPFFARFAGLPIFGGFFAAAAAGDLFLEGLERKGRKKNGLVLVLTGLGCCWRSVQVSRAMNSQRVAS